MAQHNDKTQGVTPIANDLHSIAMALSTALEQNSLNKTVVVAACNSIIAAAEQVAEYECSMYPAEMVYEDH